MKISNRIKKIASKIKPYQRIIDIGCDHGYLIIEAIINNDVKYAIGIDNKKLPLESARKNIIAHDLENFVDLKISNGLNDIDHINNIDVIIIAGMGTDNIISILKDSRLKLANVKRIIIDSHRDIPKLRAFMIDCNYMIVDEEIIKENNIYYEIISFERNNLSKKYTQLEIEFGPILLSKKEDLFIKKYEEELNRLTKIGEVYGNSNLALKKKYIENIIYGEEYQNESK